MQAGESTRRVVTRTSLGTFGQGALQALQQRLEMLGGFLASSFFLVLQLAQIHRTLGHRLQRLALELVEVAEHPLVDTVHQQQHLDALLAEDLQLRAALAAASESAVM